MLLSHILENTIPDNILILLLKRFNPFFMLLLYRETVKLPPSLPPHTLHFLMLLLKVPIYSFSLLGHCLTALAKKEVD